MPRDIELTSVPRAKPRHGSSIYSRPSHPVSWSGFERLILGDERPPAPIPIDREIAACGGNTVALEWTATSLQQAKTRRWGTPEERRREMLWHEQECLFFRRCFNVFQDLREAVRAVLYHIQTQGDFYPEVEPSRSPRVRAAAQQLVAAYDRAEREEQIAQDDYRHFWKQKPAEVWI